MLYEANLIPIDEDQIAHLVQCVIENDATGIETHMAEAVRVRDVQAVTQLWKRFWLEQAQATLLKSATSSKQVGESDSINRQHRCGAAMGSDSPPAFSSSHPDESPITATDPVILETQNETGCWKKNVDSLSARMQSMASRPFFMPMPPCHVVTTELKQVHKPISPSNPTDPAKVHDPFTEIDALYDRYLSAQPGNAHALVNGVAKQAMGASGFSSPPRDQAPASREVIQYEVGWKYQLLCKAFANLPRMRAVFDADREPYHPHQLLSEEAPMIFVEFAARLRPGWTVDGPWNPTNLLPVDGLDGKGLFESPMRLFEPLIQNVPALCDALHTRIEKPFSVGGYVRPANVHRLVGQLNRLRCEHAANAGPESESISTQQHALAMWHEAADHARRQGLGLIETADLYNRKEEVLN